MLNKIKNGFSGFGFFYGPFLNRYLKFVGFIYGVLMDGNVKMI